ncbi:hypothetical protein P389DRAFT_190773, partial [Cystobasidium minutum MCA 4210]|uniref:uncharacterized protein n=1 Tax=Cystobasidium minutum MCA 4210 TaxID=1397322 RepID=UPI0034CE2229|eukprot:jgi/Rhomi1/190773/estExt_fgenesh1_pg.C_60059
MSSKSSRCVSSLFFLLSCQGPFAKSTGSCNSGDGPLYYGLTPNQNEFTHQQLYPVSVTASVFPNSQIGYYAPLNTPAIQAPNQGQAFMWPTFSSIYNQVPLFMPIASDLYFDQQCNNGGGASEKPPLTQDSNTAVRLPGSRNITSEDIPIPSISCSETSSSMDDSLKVKANRSRRKRQRSWDSEAEEVRTRAHYSEPAFPAPDLRKRSHRKKMESERKRRKAIASAIEDLRQLLPTSAKKSHKSDIVILAAE